MFKTRFSYLKFTALIAVFGMSLAPYLSTSAEGSRPSSALVGADLTSEERIISRYFDDLGAYNKETGELGRKARLVNTELEPVQRKSDDLKGRLRDVQDAVREIVRKLKAAGEWEDLDTTIIARITDARDRSHFQQHSYKKLLEDSSTGLTSYGSEISTPLDNLRKKISSRTFSPYGDAQIVRASYEAPVLFATGGLACAGANLRLGLLWRLGAKENSATSNARICACYGGATCTNATS